MGQQQLLLIILGVIIVGIAIGVGITMFNDNSVSANRDAMSIDMMHLAAKARHYYGRPSSMGGGSHSFLGITIDKIAISSFYNNSNGAYSIISIERDSIKFRGMGKVLKPAGDSTELQLTVTPAGPRNIVIIN